MTIDELRECSTLLARMACNAERLQRALTRAREEWEQIPEEARLLDPDDEDVLAASMELAKAIG